MLMLTDCTLPRVPPRSGVAAFPLLIELWVQSAQPRLTDPHTGDARADIGDVSHQVPVDPDQPDGLDPQLNPQPSTLNNQPSTLNPQPSTLNPQPTTLNPQP